MTNPTGNTSVAKTPKGSVKTVPAIGGKGLVEVEGCPYGYNIELLPGRKHIYRAVKLDDQGNEVLETETKMRSVTTILDIISAKKLSHWYYLQTVKGFAFLLNKYGDNLPRDEESLRSLLTTEGVSPYGVRNAGGSRGTAVHTDLETLAAGKKVKRVTEHNKPLLDWWEQRELQPKHILATEVQLPSFKYGYAGTIDLVYRDPQDGKVILADLKTSNSIVWTHFLQASAYKQVWEENGGEKVANTTIIHCSKGKFAELDCEVPFEIFLNTLAIYDSLPYDWDILDGGEV